MAKEKDSKMLTEALEIFQQQVKENEKAREKMEKVWKCPECGSFEGIEFFDDVLCKKCLAPMEISKNDKEDKEDK